MYHNMEGFRKEFNISIDKIIIEIPEIQRSLDEDAVQRIYDFQDYFYQKHGYYCTNGIISIAININTNVNYLIDGQHRIVAFKKLREKYPHREIALSIDYYDYKDDKVLDELYKLVNTCTINPVTTLGIDIYKLVNEIEKYLSTDFKQYISKSEIPQRPNISLPNLRTYLSEGEKVKNFINLQTFVRELIAINTFYSTVSDDKYVKWGVEKITECKGKINEKTTKLYVGLYRNFEWLDRIQDKILTGVEYDKMEHYSNTKRKLISQELRMMVWNSTNIIGNCHCCDSVITVMNFECGHVIPVAKGGKTELSNLKKICRNCNEKMGTINMDEFILMHSN